MAQQNTNSETEPCVGGEDNGKVFSYNTYALQCMIGLKFSPSDVISIAS